MTGIFFTFKSCKVSKVEDYFSMCTKCYIIDEKTAKLEDVFLFWKEFMKRKGLEEEIILTASRGSEVRTFEIEKVSHIESSGRLLTIYGDFKKFEFYGRLKHIQKKIEKLGFIRVNNSFIVYEKSIERELKKEVKLKNGIWLNKGKEYEKKNIIELN